MASDGAESSCTSSHESFTECPLPDTAEQGDKIRCDCGRIWGYDGQYFVLEGSTDD